MRTSPNGLVFLENNEGRVLHVYLDSAGIPTVGVGHVVLPSDGLRMGDAITEEECQALLAHDVGHAEAAINGAVGATPCTQNQFDAMVSLTFNIGVGGFLSSTVLKDFLAGNIADERRAFRLWDKAHKLGAAAGVLVVDAALLARRDREVALFLTPDAPPTA